MGGRFPDRGAGRPPCPLWPSLRPIQEPGRIPEKDKAAAGAAGMIGGHIMPPALVVAVVIAEPVALFAVVGLPPSGS